MIQLKEVIHYYIGQRFLYSSHHEPQNESYVLRASMLSETVSFGDRPILRRLEDMGEDEMRLLYRARTWWAYIQDSHIKKIGFDKDNLNAINIDYEGPSGSSGYTVGHEIMYMNALMPNQFHYLLKQGFDLFGLIQSGQAIDAKTIQPPQTQQL